MGVREAIEALHARGDLDADQKRIQASVLKRDAWLAAAQGQLPHTFSPGPFDVTIRSIKALGNAVSIRVTVQRNGVTLPLDPHHVIVNAPPLIDDPAGDIIRLGAQGKVIRRLREAPFEALKAALADTIRQQIAGLKP